MKLLSIGFACGLLLACGGGAGGADAAVAQPSAASGGSPVLAPTNADGSVAITSVKVQNLSQASGTGGINYTPVTFGQVFAAGDVADPNTLVGKLSDGTPIALQVDAKATHADGSLRHAVITAVIPFTMTAAPTTLSINRATTPAARGSGADPTTLLANGFTASVNLTVGGQVYSLSAEQLLRSGKYNTWLSGPQVNEWQVSGPLKNASGAAHPQLSARFAIRSYSGTNSATVDVTIENDWAYAPAPQNITYDAQVMVGGKSVYTKSALKHFHHARWRKVFWWGQPHQVFIQHDTAYLIATKAVSNYVRLGVAPSALSNIASKYTGAAFDAMGNGLAVAYMPTTGGRGDIGLLPSWAVSYLLSMDRTAKAATLGTGDMSGSWSMHYRNQNTDRPVSLIDYPYMTLAGNPGDAYNPVTKKSEAFPVCGGDCSTPFTADPGHAPAMAYLPYLVTGDYYYLEEIQFWANYELFQSNPGYRGNIKGLINHQQVRAQAWSLRDLARTAYITPDSDVLKKQLENFLSNNLDWYNTTYSFSNVPGNTFGAMTDALARVYDSSTGIAPWQDDFFTSAVGHTVELGYAKAKPLLAWKAKFPVKRMTDPSYCWIVGAVYSFRVTDSATAPIYTDMGRSYVGSNPSSLTALTCASTDMASLLKLQPQEMTGYSNAPEGYPSNMQPALAYAVDSGVPGAKDAWAKFSLRANQPDYSTSPQFAIVPRP